MSLLNTPESIMEYRRAPCNTFSIIVKKYSMKVHFYADNAAKSGVGSRFSLLQPSNHTEKLELLF